MKARRAHAKHMNASATTRQRRVSEPVTFPLWTCPDCGGEVSERHRVRCDSCIGADPRQGLELRATRAAAILARKQALQARADAGLPAWADRDWYRAEVLPRLGRHKLSEIVEASGCSKASASDYRAGRHVPHVSTWAALAELVGVEAEQALSEVVS